jgi:hypothetical protein
VDWIKRYIFFNDKRHPQEMGATEVAQFLSYLATERRVAAAGAQGCSGEEWASRVRLIPWDETLAVSEALPPGA